MNIQTNKVPMSQKDREELANFKAAGEKLVKEHTKSKEAARKFLVELGILNQDGTLTKEYQS